MDQQRSQRIQFRNKIALICVIFLLSELITTVSALKDYCSFYRSCGRKKHIGCERSAWDIDFTVDLIPITEVDRIEFIDIINKFRSDVAMGKYKTVNGTYKTLQTATNMRLKHWNYELAYLAELNINKTAKDFNVCYKTNEFDDPHMIHYYPTFNNSTLTMIKTVAEQFIEYSLNPM